MALRLLLSRRAERDIDRLEEFIANETRGRAQRAMSDLSGGMRRLERFPELGVSIGKGFRQLYISSGKSGYVVRYRILTDAVMVVRIWHGKENRPR